VREKTGWTAQCCHTWRLTEISLAMLSGGAHKWRCTFINKHLRLGSENEIIFSELRSCKHVIGAILCRQSCSVCPSVPVRIQWWWERDRQTDWQRELPACITSGIHLWKRFQLLQRILITDWQIDMYRFCTVLLSATSRHYARYKLPKLWISIQKTKKKNNCT
jgi:hypothetical protein